MTTDSAKPKTLTFDVTYRADKKQFFVTPTDDSVTLQDLGSTYLRIVPEGTKPLGIGTISCHCTFAALFKKMERDHQGLSMVAAERFLSDVKFTVVFDLDTDTFSVTSSDIDIPETPKTHSQEVRAAERLPGSGVMIIGRYCVLGSSAPEHSSCEGKYPHLQFIVSRAHLRNQTA